MLTLSLDVKGKKHMAMIPQAIYNLIQLTFVDNEPKIEVKAKSDAAFNLYAWQNSYLPEFMFQGWEIWIAEPMPDGLRWVSRQFYCHGENKFRTHTLSVLGATGYAYLNARNDLRKVCYVCAASIDQDHMDKTGKITLYLDGLSSLRLNPARTNKQKTASGVKIMVSNYCGSLSYPVELVRTGNGGINKIRRDIYFTDHAGRVWWGVQFGNKSPLVYCKRMKEGYEIGKDQRANRSNGRKESEGKDSRGKRSSVEQ